MPAPLILAQSFKAAHQYATEELGLSVGHYRVVTTAGTIKAVRGVDIHLVPGWEKRPDRFTMRSALKWSRLNIVDVEKLRESRAAFDAAMPPAVEIHFVSNGGMLHALPDVSAGAEGVDTPEDVTCPTCVEILERDGLPKAGPSERDLEVAYRYNRLLDAVVDQNPEIGTLNGVPVIEHATEEEAQAANLVDQIVTLAGPAATTPTPSVISPEAEALAAAAPKKRRRTRCKDCGNLHFKEEPCPPSEDA